MLKFSSEPGHAMDLSCAALKVIKLDHIDEEKIMRQTKIVNSIKDVLCEAKGVYSVVTSQKAFGQSFLMLVDLVDKQSSLLKSTLRGR